MKTEKSGGARRQKRRADDEALHQRALVFFEARRETLRGSKRFENVVVVDGDVLNHLRRRHRAREYPSRRVQRGEPLVRRLVAPRQATRRRRHAERAGELSREVLGDARQSVRAELDHRDAVFVTLPGFKHAEINGAAAVHVHRADAVSRVVVDVVVARRAQKKLSRREFLRAHDVYQLGPVQGLRDVRGDAGVEAGLQPRAAARGVRPPARAARERAGQALRRRVRRARAAGRFPGSRLPRDRIRAGRDEVRRGLEEHGRHLLDGRVAPSTDIERDAVNAQGGALAHVETRGGV